MSRLVIKTAVLGCVLVGSLATPSRAARWADSLFSEQAHDFGPVPRGAKVRHPFVLTNRLQEPITILNVRASCGCTTGTANASLVKPGESAVVEAQMDTRNFVDRKETALFVSLMTASGREAEVRLGVASTILSDIVLNPGSIDFGAVTKGQTPSRSLTIERIGAPNWKCVRMVSTSRVINATLTETVRNDSTVGYSLTVSLKPDAPAGFVRDEIRILTNDAETPSIPVPVLAQIRGELTVSPNPLALGNVTSAGGVQGRVFVKASKPFTVRSVEGNGDGFKLAEAEPSRKALHIFTVSYKPEESNSRGDLRRVFRLLTDLPGEGPVDVAVSLHVEP